MSNSNRMKVIFNHLNPPKIPIYKRTSTSKYFYTIDNCILSKNQRQFYEENGYIVIKNIIDHKLLDEAKQRFIEYCDGKLELGFANLLKEISLISSAKGEYLYNKIQNILWDEVFNKYFTDEKLLDYVQCFTGPDIYCLNSMLINKPPNAETLTAMHPLHQDYHYLPLTQSNRIVATWTAMEDVTVENGCLFVIPGSHKSSYMPHRYPEFQVNLGFYGVQGFDKVPKLKLIMEKGDTVFFNPLLLHGSGPNMTKGFRKAISGHYCSSHCAIIDIKGTTQEDFMNELIEKFKKRGFEFNNLQEFFSVRAKLVRGISGKYL